jgi:ABC-type antimicrobial peptide transport system permease subunit
VQPLGRRIAVRLNGVDLEVVGVVRDGKYGSLRERGRLAVYMPADLQDSGVRSSETFFVRTSGDPQTAIAAIEQEIRQRDPELAITAAGTMTDRIAELAMTQRIGASLFGWFSAVALALAVLGVYGLVAYAVARRTNEIGIRMALGGTASDVVRLMMTRALVPAAVGVAAGGVVLIIGVAVASYVPARRAACVDPVTALRTT